MPIRPRGRRGARGDVPTYPWVDPGRVGLPMGSWIDPGGPSQFIEPSTSNSLENFISTFRTYAHPNKYEVLIFPPAKPAEGDQNPSKNLLFKVRGDAREISLRCESVTLPSRNLASSPDTNIHGPLREIVNNVNYADTVSMTFQSSADLRERVFFEKWQYTAFNPDTWNVGYYDDYIGQVEIYLLDRDDQRKYGLRLEECFPKSISQTDLSYATNNEIIKLTIEMNFRYWKTLDTTQTSKSMQELVEASAARHGRNLINKGALPAVVGRHPPGLRRRYTVPV